jgi:hypothetical protein
MDVGLLFGPTSRRVARPCAAATNSVNVFQGRFPEQDTGEDGYAGTARMSRVS